MLHLADISNSAKKNFLLWTDDVLNEFYVTGDKQRLNGLQILPASNDRYTTRKEDCQVNFMKYIVKPAFEAMGPITNTVKIYSKKKKKKTEKEKEERGEEEEEEEGTTIMDLVNKNLKYWQDQQQQQQQQQQPQQS